jgi:hypothetical protein
LFLAKVAKHKKMHGLGNWTSSHNQINFGHLNLGEH